MYTTASLQDEIRQRKKEKDFCILAHTYQSHDILEVADYVGDSYGLSVQAKKATQKNILMCGVRFMAETVKILSPDKRVFLSHPEAGCPMAEQITPETILQCKKSYTDYVVVAYINTTAELKTVCDVCVTSASAVDVIRNIDSHHILFVPDCNLGAWVAEQIPEKHFRFVSGGCPVHARITPQEVAYAKKRHPTAKLLVHPECVAEVVAQADFAGSTTGIMDYAQKSPDKEFLIGTENSIVTHLQYACPDKRFFALSKYCVCENMRLTTLTEVYDCIVHGGEEIDLQQEVMAKARRCIDNMLLLNTKNKNA